MKKITLLLFLTFSLVGLMVPVQAEVDSDTLDITVTAEFEETDYQGHAITPTEVSFHINQLWPFDDIVNFNLNIDNNYTKNFVGLENGNYRISLKNFFNNPIYKYYQVEPISVEMEESGEVIFKFNKERSDIRLELRHGDSESRHEIECSYGGIAGRQVLDNQPSLFNADGIQTDEIYDLSGAVFELLDEHNNTIHTATTDIEGNLIFENILYGEYKVKQISAPEGLEIDDSILNIDLFKEDGSQGCLGRINWYNDLKKDEPIVDEPIVDEPGESEQPDIEEPIVKVPNESEESNIDKPVLDIPEELEKPKIDNLENAGVPEDLDVVVEEPTKSVVSENNDVNVKERLKAPNTGINSSYAPYILLILLGLLSMVSRSYYKMRKINKRK